MAMSCAGLWDKAFPLLLLLMSGVWLDSAVCTILNFSSMTPCVPYSIPKPPKHVTGFSLLTYVVILVGLFRFKYEVHKLAKYAIAKKYE